MNQAEREWGAWQKHGAQGMRGGDALAREMDRILHSHGIASPVTSKRGLSARLRYLDSAAGREALREAGVKPRTLRDWRAGRTTPSRASREKIDAAYWSRRRENLMRSGAMKRHLNNDGRGTRMEIYPVDQSDVPEKYRRPTVQSRTIQVRYVWDDAVDAWGAGNGDILGEIWDDIIADLDSDWVAYAYVSGVGLSA
ncbi:hypothetical protein [Streptomyces daliensis]|uniref:Transcriptional regulator n=1 Tax=Streptomyces daliensis TaxID=299421 RepID=A0A8T4J4A4_9ACTN|nr:hypothetical protein [Streptomyces daliensis]